MALPDTEGEAAARSFLNAIGAEALEGTGGDVYKAGQSLAAPDLPVHESGSPAPEPAPEPQKTQPATETVAETKEDEWFIPGSYKTRDDAIRGLAETRKWANEGWDKAKQLEAQAAKPIVETPDPLTELENFGIPQKPLKEAIHTLAVQAVQQMFAPAVQKMNADKEIVARFPEYETKFNDLSQFVETTPELKAKVERAEAAGEFLLARELAWLSYERANGMVKAQQMTSAETERVEKAQEAKRDAAVTKPGAAVARTQEDWNSPNRISDENWDKLISLEKAGYPSQLWKHTIGAVLERDYPSVFGKDGKI